MNRERREGLNRLERDIGYRFSDPALLDNALTHRSFVNENPGVPCGDNERLEFLGDAVLELAISAMLMKKYPGDTEGELSKLRASVVNEKPLAALARRFHVGDLLLLGKGEEATGGRDKPSLLANAFESVVAALFLDGGYDRTAAFIGSLFEPLIGPGNLASLYRDYKTAAQELCQNRFHELPRYVVVSETGPDHDKRFHISLMIGERAIATGSGKSKKEAEQEAAQRTIFLLESLEDSSQAD